MRAIFSILVAGLLVSPALLGQQPEARIPLPEITTSAWALLLPGTCLALVVVNVGWRRKRRLPRPRPGGSDD